MARFSRKPVGTGRAGDLGFGVAALENERRTDDRRREEISLREAMLVGIEGLGEQNVQWRVYSYGLLISIEFQSYGC